MTLNIDIGAAEQPHFRTLWGQRYKAHPKFIRQTLGDGGKLLVVTPLNTRPDYYLIRVDSTWEDDSRAAAVDCVCDHIDEIYDAIEDECGRGYEDATDTPTGRARHNPWPALSSDSGSSWGKVTGKGLEEILLKGAA